MSIMVEIPPFLQKFTGGREAVETTGQTVGECLDNLEIQFPGIKHQLFDKRGCLGLFEIYINSESSYPEELAKLLKDGDKLTIVALIGGG